MGGYWSHVGYRDVSCNPYLSSSLFIAFHTHVLTNNTHTQTSHWYTIFAALGEDYFPLHPYTLTDFTLYNVFEHSEIIFEICHDAMQEKRLREQVSVHTYMPQISFLVARGMSFLVARGMSFLVARGMSFLVARGMSFLVARGMSFLVARGMSFLVARGMSFLVARGMSFLVARGI